MVLQVVGPADETVHGSFSDGSDLLGFLSDGASMLVRSSLLQVGAAYVYVHVAAAATMLRQCGSCPVLSPLSPACVSHVS